MAEMFHKTSSPAPSPSPSPSRRSTPESDEISVFLQHLLHSSSSSSSSSSSMNTYYSKSKQIPFSSPLPPHFFSSSSSSSTTGLSETQNRSTLLLSNSDCLVREGTSTAEPSGVYLSTNTTVTGNISLVAGDCDAVTTTTTTSFKRRKIPIDNNDLDDFDCESEDALEASEEPSKRVLPRTSSKRSRAAEVHNLSEKRRRSRINEKMKALQNLIPNSNKTDKASMLDEAIEYLKQLQLQVQMLSMRNGLSLHPMYIPGALQRMQLPEMRVGFCEGNGSLHMNMGMGTLPVNQETSTQAAFGLSNQCTSSHQPIAMPNVTNISSSGTSFVLESPIQVQHRPFQLSTVSEEFYREDILPQQQLDMNHSTRNPSALPFDTRTSVLEDSNCMEASVIQKERLQDVPKDEDSQILIQHLHGLQTGGSVHNNDMKIRDF